MAKHLSTYLFESGNCMETSYSFLQLINFEFYSLGILLFLMFGLLTVIVVVLGVNFYKNICYRRDSANADVHRLPST